MARRSQIYAERRIPVRRARGAVLAFCLLSLPLTERAPAQSVDLRPAFREMGLGPRRQGNRPTCSVFTLAGAMEYALAKRQGHCPRLSVEFLNWASNNACGDTEDGGFFSDLWKGFAAYGICAEEEMPYQPRFDSSRLPSAGALADAKTRLALGLRLHWIKEWNVNTGLTEPEFQGVKRTLARGWPVCGGFRWPKQEQWTEDVLQMCPSNAVRDGHSVLLAGYRDDAAQPGGGVLIFRNTSRDGAEGFMPYAYARLYMNDAVWVDFDSRTVPDAAPGGRAALLGNPLGARVSPWAGFRESLHSLLRMHWGHEPRRSGVSVPPGRDW